MNYYVGDFNANGENDLLFEIYTEIDSKSVVDSEESKTTIKRTLFYPAETKLPEDNIILISDGMNITNWISFDTYRKDLNIEVNYAHPVGINRQPYTLVSKIYSVTNNPLQPATLMKEFDFKNLIMHYQGKGALGFMETEMRDLENGVKSKFKYNLLINSNRNYFLYPAEIKTFVLTQNRDIPLSETFNTVGIKETIESEPKIFIPVTTKSYTKSWDLDGTYKGITYVKQDLWNIDSYGNPKMKEVLNDEFNATILESDWNWETQYWTMYSHNHLDGKWYSQLDTTVVKSRSFECTDWKFNHIVHEHYPNGLLKSSKSIAAYNQFNSPLVKKIKFEYDIYGNMTKETINAPNNSQLSDRITEYEYRQDYGGRLLTKKTIIGSANITTAYEYYRKKGLLKEKMELLNPEEGSYWVKTKYEYDSLGSLTKTKHPDGTYSINETLWSGTAGGEVPTTAVVKLRSYKQTIDAQLWGSTTAYLDKYGNELRSVQQNLQGSYVYIDKVYDIYGRIINVSEPYFEGSPTNLKTIFVYDELGRISTVTKPDGTIMKTTYKGRAVKTKNMTSKFWSEKVVNAIGLVDLVIDTLGSTDASARINYNYDGLGRPVSTVSFYKTTSFEYDAAGNQSKLIDPNAGTSNYTYNAYSELLTQQDARGNIYQMGYDDLGRIETKTLVSGGNDVTSYTYYNTLGDDGFGQLKKMEHSNATSTAYSYDYLGRIISKTETIDGNIFNFAYTYNSSTGMLETYQYPSDYKLKYLYDSRGNQHEVRNAGTNALLWKSNTVNQRGQITNATMGNGAVTEYGWSAYGYPEMNKVSKGTTVLQHFTYNFNPSTGNLSYRRDNKRSIQENFAYDGLLQNRLTYWSATGGGTISMDYHANGNILKKTDVTSASEGYKYEGVKPNAVTKVVSPTTPFVQNNQQQDITYTAFNKVEHILNNDALDYQLYLTYGPDNQRKKSFMNKLTGHPNVPEVLKYYLDNYEYEYRDESTRLLHYLQGPDGLFAIMVKQGTSQTMYYVHKDHLGSITAISDATGNLVESLSYDPWGRRRKANDWNDYNVTSTMFDRGFTGHEHLPQFGLINMNGRVYDPFLARFLSPDPFVQAPDYTQNYNRYSYCVNNPLKYTDPSGEIFGTVFTFLWDLGTTIFTKGGIDPWNTSENRGKAWRDFDPSGSWSKTNKAWKIDKGFIKTDPNRSDARRVLQFISRFTWELPQTLIGNLASHTRNVSGRVDNVDYYGGATLVNMNDNTRIKWGFSLGPYINSKNMVADPYTDDMFRHEYGHTLQSQLVGPLYLTHIALPSLIGQGLDDIGWNDHNREWYETQANRMSERYFRNHDPNALTALPWDDTRYPRVYNPNWYWLFAHPPVPFMWWLFF